MLDKTFVQDGFIIDASNAKDASDVVFELTSVLEIPEAKGKKIGLKLGEVDLTQSQLLSIKSLIDTLGSFLETVDTNSEKTKSAAQELGINSEKISNEIEVQETEDSEADIKEIEVGEPKDGLSFDLVDEKIELVEMQEEEKSEEIISQDENVEAEEELQINADELAALDEISKLPTFYLKQNLRSGQTMSYDGNVVLIGDAKPGSEIIAKGDITVWGVLGGIAHAGARGNDYARIRALKIHAIQLRVSGYYARRPDSINIPFIQKSDTFTPEEARVSNGEIAIYKICEM